MNNALYRDLRILNSFVTVFCVDWDSTTGTFSYASAGHSLPEIIRKDTTQFDMPSVRGIMLGGLPNQVYKEEKVTLSEGDLVFLYTDGIVEAVNKENEMYKVDRLKNVLKSVVSKNIKTIEETVIEDIKVFTEGLPQRDDITMCNERRMDMGELITSKGKNAKEAVDLALSLLGKDISEVEIEILKHEEKSFLGFISKPAVVKVKVKDEVMLIEAEPNESSHLVMDNGIESASQTIEEFLSSIENESLNTDVNFNLDPFDIENIRGKAWIIDGKVYCKDAKNKYPLIEPSKDVRIFKNGKLIQSTEIITETDVFKIEAPSEEILPSWELSI
ncbi:SpoIIE-domain-containing protein, partial [Rhizophagus irregularis]